MHHITDIDNVLVNYTPYSKQECCRLGFNIVQIKGRILFGDVKQSVDKRQIARCVRHSVGENAID